MKTRYNIYSLIIVALILMMQGCDETETEIEIEASHKEGLTLSTTDANFVVTNMTTGESAENHGELNNPDRLVIYNGDIVRLSYTPKEGNEQYNWEVMFDLAGEQILADDSYTAQYTVADLTPGKYTITCSSEMREDISEEEFWGLKETGYVYVEIVGD